VKNNIKLPRTVATSLARDGEEEQDSEENSVLEYIKSAVRLALCTMEFI
jgi:hypothetical protein